jgi:hypothetical protein
MAAGLGFKTFTSGEVLTAANVNGYLMQGINVFASTAARDAAITSPQEGQFAFTKDTNGLWYYDGAAWVASGATGDIEGVTAGVGISGGGTSGTVTVTNSMATAIDAKGDLVPGTGADTFARLAVGANNTVLTADSAEATGLKWATVAAGGMTQISTTSLTGSSTTISSIPSTYVNLYLAIKNVSVSSTTSVNMRFNGNTSGVYGWSYLGAGQSLGGNSDTSIYFLGNYIYASGSSSANSIGVNIFNYTNSISSCNYGMLSYTNSNEYRGGSGGGGADVGAAISSITLFPGGQTFSSGTATLYGVK